jgi:hypothetical protein
LKSGSLAIFLKSSCPNNFSLVIFSFINVKSIVIYVCLFCNVVFFSLVGNVFGLCVRAGFGAQNC